MPRSEVVARPTREVTVHWPPGMIDVLMLLSAVFPARRLAPPAWALLRAARHRPGHCRTCNYNLTGNQSGVCPECGTPLPPTEQKNRATVT